MCTHYENCTGCPLEGASCVVSKDTYDEDYKRIIAAVEQWSKGHPRKTRQDLFLQHYPNAPRDKGNLLTACPKCVDGNVSCVDKTATEPTFKCCDNCRREFWMQEVE